MSEHVVYVAKGGTTPGYDGWEVSIQTTGEDGNRVRRVILVTAVSYGEGLTDQFTPEMAEALGRALLDAALQLRKESHEP